MIFFLHISFVFSDEYEAYEGYKCSISGLSAYLPYKTMDDAKNKCNVDENCLGVLRYRSSNFGTKYYACSYPNGIMQDKSYDFYMKKLNLRKFLSQVLSKF